MIDIKTVPIPGLTVEFGVYPITQAQYQAVMGTNPSHFKGDNRPVESVSWFDAVKFCEKLSELTGREYRLPTSEEWETALGVQKLSLKTGWFYENSNRQTHPVGQKQPNRFGLYDMHGNVWEWCADEEDEYKHLRGGSWAGDLIDARAVFRYDYPPANRDDFIGFRVVCSVRPPSQPEN